MGISPVFLNWTPFSPTPRFSFNPGSGFAFKMVLTGDVTSSTVDTSTLSPSTRVAFVLLQDAIGGHAFAWPANCLGAQPIAAGANQTTVQSFIFDGVNLLSHGIPAIF
jgi:hypothetical protein